MRHFIFASEVMNLILNFLAPADKTLQPQSSSLVAGYDVIKSTYRRDWKIKKRCRVWINTAKIPVQLSHALNKLKKSVSSQFRNDVITEHVGIYNESESLNLKLTLKSPILFRANSAAGFWNLNMPLIKSLPALSPASNSFLDKEQF